MKSLMTAATRPSPPHVPVRNRNGTSIRSKKITNSARSWGISAPSTPLSARQNQTTKSAGRAAAVDADPEEEQPRPLPLGERGPDRAREEEHRREQDQEQVQPVDPELVVDAELADAPVVGGTLQPEGAGL